MNYKKRLFEHLKLLFSKKGYDLTFNKKHPEYKDGLTFNENQIGHFNTYLLTAEYFSLGVFVILSIILFYYFGLDATKYVFILFMVPLILIFINSTTTFYNISKRYGDDKGTSFLLFLNLGFVPSLVMMGIFAGLIEDNIVSGVGLIVSMVFPWLLMLCRISVFSDNSIPKYEGPKMSIELGPGYVPIIYWLLSIQIGFALTVTGFKTIKTSLISGHPSLVFCLVAVFLGLFCQGLVTFPDKIDKFVPVDMRMKEGYLLMAGLTIGLVMASWFLLDALKTII